MNENTGKTKKELRKEILKQQGSTGSRNGSGNIRRDLSHDTGFEHV